MTKQQQISAAVIARVMAGAPIEAAFDSVMGAGAYAKLAAELYEALRAA